MSDEDLEKLKKQLENCRTVPEKAMAHLIDVVERVVSHLASERNGREKVHASVKEFKNQLHGWYDAEGRKHIGFFDSVNEMKESNTRTREQSRENAKSLKRLTLTVGSAVLIYVIQLVLSKIKF